MRRPWVRAAFFLLLAMAAAAMEAQDAKAVLGVWRGTSLCANREATPACKDEEVVYEFREATPPNGGRLHWKADKVVNGEVQTMGELDLVWDGKAGAWVCEIQTRYHGLWSFAPPKDGELAGSLVLLPERTVVRKVAVRRAKAAAS